MRKFYQRKKAVLENNFAMEKSATIKRFFTEFSSRTLLLGRSETNIGFRRRKLAARCLSRGCENIQRKKKEKFEGMACLQGKFSTRKSRATVSLRQIK